MKSLKHIFGLLMMGALIVVAGCNKEENGGKKENLPHPTSTYKACPILAHWKNEKLGIKEIHIKEIGHKYESIYVYDKEQRLIKITEGEYSSEYEYNYDLQGRLIKVKEFDYEYIISYDKGRLIKVKEFDYEYIISYDNYGFIDSVIYNNDENDIHCLTFIYSKDTVLMKTEYEDEGKLVEYKYIMKFSDDLYLTYTASIDDERWVKYNWQNGNLISMYDNKGRKENYQYDNSLNICRLTFRNQDLALCLGVDDSPNFNSKNNLIEEGEKYTYNDKGMVETISSKDENGVEKVWYSFSYIYY